MSEALFTPRRPKVEVVPAEGRPLTRPDYPAMVEQVRAMIARAGWDEQINQLAQVAEALKVDSEPANVEAVEIAGQVKQALKGLDAKRHEIVDEPTKFTRSVNSLFKQYFDKLKGVESSLKRKIGGYQARLEMERRKAEAAAAKAAAEAQKRLDEEAAKAGVEPVKVEVPKVAPASTATRTAAGTSHTVKVWKFKVTDPGRVPRKYCSPDERLIRRAVRDGIRKIAGVGIYQETEVRIRT